MCYITDLPTDVSPLWFAKHGTNMHTIQVEKLI